MLSADNGPLRWVPMVDGVIPIVIHRKGVGADEVFEVTASTHKGTVFNTEFNLKEIRLKKTSDFFVQWRNRKSRNAWGLNFISAEEADRFMQFCQVARVRSWSSSSSSACGSSAMQASPSNSPHEKSHAQPENSTSDPSNRATPSDTQTLRQSIGEQYSSSSTLVGMETASNGSSLGNGSVPARKISTTSSHGNTGLTQAAPDSWFDADDYESDPSRPTSSASDVEQRLDESGHASELDDSAERSYFQEMARLHSPEPMEISASFHEDAEQSSTCGTDTDLKPRSGIAQSRQGGATRKAGWLSGKHVLTRGKGGKLEQASDRKWRKYWMTLRSAALNFYLCNEKTVSAQDLDDPTFSIEIDGCIAQAVPEHAKLDHVFSVSMRLGEAYYFQAANQTDLENWVTAIHSMAASLLTGPGPKSKDEMLRILNKRSKETEERIESDSKLKKMAELQSSVVTDHKTKQQFVDQISRWEKNLEELHITFHRLQCYTSAVQGTPLPNPQTLLACVSRNTKQTLSRLGVFSVTSFHSVVSARDPSVEVEVKARNKAKRSPSSVGRLKTALFTSLRINDAASVKSIRDRYSPRSAQNNRRQNLESISDSNEEESESARSLSSSHSDWKSLGNYLRISLPSNQATVIPLGHDMTVREAVESTCQKRQLEPRAHYLRLGKEDNNGVIDFYTPDEDSLLEDLHYSHLKLCERCVFSVELTKSLEMGGLDFGISVTCRNDALYISQVEEGRLAHVQGVQAGDEILAVNDVNAEDVENPIDDLQAALQDPCITLKLRSPREEPPVSSKVTSDAIISSLVLPAPPKISHDLDQQDLSELIVPPPMLDFDDGDASSVLSTDSFTTSHTNNTHNSTTTVDELLQQAEQVTIFCRQQLEIQDEDQGTKPAVHFTPAQKLRKVIYELAETERSYVKDLKLLLNRFLDPLKDENFMSQAEVKALVGTVDEILDFQITFLSEMERLLSSETGFDAFDTIPQFQNVIYTIGETFLQYTEHFKLYSAFCSSHSRVVELLGPGKNEALRNFLDARNPKNQHSGTLESYFIKPIQRILRYPLLLRTILKLLDETSEEYKVLLEAVVAIEKVATHINEMQRITERFAPIFNQLVEDYDDCEVSDVTIDRLLHHGKVTWLNCPDEPRSGTLKVRYPVSPRLYKKTTNNIMHLFVFEKIIILVHMETKSRKKEKSSSHKLSEEIKFKFLIPVTSLVLRDHCWANDTDTLHSWELVNISDTTELGKQECAYLFASKTAGEKREMVRSIKEAIKRGIRAGSTASTIRSHNSFRRTDTSRPQAPPLKHTAIRSLSASTNEAEGGNFLRINDNNLLRRSFSHNPEEAKTRRTSLVEHEHKQYLSLLGVVGSHSQENIPESVEQRVVVVHKDDSPKQLEIGSY
ncbi:protein still life, isoform SIF type 1 isoform X2 [Nematostella vectensis]|uniref:protein still life, isoform SIF type 1 isoform X2 n=1 Tax=Nematostella vectensis TaxID=45351 RepID=UPI00138FC019|nr:protein still life, isoform SIF type 1 isoform X2 [Nematostella vectensis]